MESDMDRAMDHLNILGRDDDGRCQTLKDFCKKIKQLEGDNFQLRLRIYMNEQKSNGGSINTFDPFSKNELANEYTLMKKQKDEAEQKLREFQNNSSSATTATTKLTNANNNDDNYNSKQKIAEMTRALVDIGTKYNHLEAENKYLHVQLEDAQDNAKSMKLSIDRLKEMYEGKVRELQEEQSKNLNLAVRLEKAQNQLERSLSDINILRKEGEKQMSVRQDHAHNRQISQLLAGNQDLRCRLGISEEALKVLYQEHIKLVAELRHLKANSTAQLHVMNQHNEAPVIAAAMGRADRHDSVRHNLSSPDLGIGLESGQEAPSNENNDDDEISMLRRQKSHLVYKLHQTRQALDKTATRLSSTTKHKEQVERAVCRQLHKTHSILKEAKQSLEKKQSQQVLTDLLPSSV